MSEGKDDFLPVLPSGRGMWLNEHEPVRFNRPLHVLGGSALGPHSIPKKTKGGLLSCLGGNVFQSIVPEASSARSQSKDAKPDTSDSGGSEGLPAQAYGWVVDQRSLAFRRRRYFSVLGRLDCTSMVAIRDHLGRTHGRSPEVRHVVYDSPVTLFTNFGLGPRFLVPAGSRKRAVKPVEWLDVNPRLPGDVRATTTTSSSSSAIEDLHRPWHWLIRPVQPRAPRASSAKEETEEEALLLVRLGDSVAIESAMYPGHFLHLVDGRVVLAEGRGGHEQEEGGGCCSEFQLSGVSLRFALQLDPALRLTTTTSSPADSSWMVGGLLQAPPIGWESTSSRSLPSSYYSPVPSVRSRGDEQAAAASHHSRTASCESLGEPHPAAALIEDMLPPELLSCIVEFFRCDTEGYTGLDCSEAKVAEHSVSIPQRREAARALMSVRRVSRRWRDLATEHVSSIRIGDLDDFSTAKQRAAMLQTALACRGLRSLSLRNLDKLTDEEVASLRPLTTLRYLNLGGCVRLSDAIMETLSSLPLVQLNLSVTRITDHGLRLLVASTEGDSSGSGDEQHSVASKRLTTLTLYGVTRITEGGVTRMAQWLPYLVSLNLRATGISKEAGQRIRASCPNKFCQVLTGASLHGSVYLGGGQEDGAVAGDPPP